MAASTGRGVAKDIVGNEIDSVTSKPNVNRTVIKGIFNHIRKIFAALPEIC
jgi:hypothetical protein